MILSSVSCVLIALYKLQLNFSVSVYALLVFWIISDDSWSFICHLTLT